MAIAPNSDVSGTGWTATPSGALYACMDEASADQSDYITTDVSGASPVILGLASSVKAGSHTVDVMLATSIGAAYGRVSLLDSSNAVQGASDWQAIDSTPAAYALAVVTTGAATRIQVEISATAGIVGSLSLNGDQLSLNGSDLGLT